MQTISDAELLLLFQIKKQVVDFLKVGGCTIEAKLSLVLNLFILKLVLHS